MRRHCRECGCRSRCSGGSPAIVQSMPDSGVTHRTNLEFCKRHFLTSTYGVTQNKPPTTDFLNELRIPNTFLIVSSRRTFGADCQFIISLYPKVRLDRVIKMIRYIELVRKISSGRFILGHSVCAISVRGFLSRRGVFFYFEVFMPLQCGVLAPFHDILTLD